MTGLILMLAVAAAMALLREPLGRGLFALVRRLDRKRLALMVVLLFLVWALLHHVQVVAGPITGDGLAVLLDPATYVALFDASAYVDLAIGVAALVLDRRTRQMLGRVFDLARSIFQRAMGRTGRARRTPARLRRRPPDRDEPDPGVFDGVMAAA
jgi:hypothetical protein